MGARPGLSPIAGLSGWRLHGLRGLRFTQPPRFRHPQHPACTGLPLPSLARGSRSSRRSYLHIIMIYRILSTLLVAFSFSIATAQIPNGGFEQWVDQGGYLDPVGWRTYNDAVPGATVIFVERGSPGPVGNYHAVLTSRLVPGSSIPIQGWVSAGVSGTNAGFPYASRSAALTGLWQYGIQPTDSGQVVAAFSKWNTLTSSTELIGFGSLEVTGDLTEWQSFSVPIEYFSSETPDTAFVWIAASIDFTAPVAGSFMKIDDLAFVGSVGMNEHVVDARVSMFPSPATDFLNIRTSVPGTLNFTDVNGRRVMSTAIVNDIRMIDVTGLAPGLYTYQLIGRNGFPVATGRWMKE
jgi:hypothetical protein